MSVRRTICALAVAVVLVALALTPRAEAQQSWCRVANCAWCENNRPYECDTCVAGYYESNDLCWRSPTCQVANCLRCEDDDGYDCDVCAAGYRESGGRCYLRSNGAAAATTTAVMAAAAMAGATGLMLI